MADETSAKDIELLFKVIKAMQPKQVEKKNKLAILFKDLFGFSFIVAILFVVYSVVNKDSFVNLQASQSKSELTEIDILNASKPLPAIDIEKIETVITPAETTDLVVYMPDTTKYIITSDNYLVRVYDKQ